GVAGEEARLRVVALLRADVDGHGRSLFSQRGHVRCQAPLMSAAATVPWQAPLISAAELSRARHLSCPGDHCPVPGTGHVGAGHWAGRWRGGAMVTAIKAQVSERLPPA